VGLTEGKALAHEVVGKIDGEHCGGQLRQHPRGVQSQASDQACQHRQKEHQRVGGVKDRLLVLLQVSIVRRGEALEHGQQSGQVPDQPAGFAQASLERVGFFFEA
jgi:hypothetical protein